MDQHLLQVTRVAQVGNTNRNNVVGTNTAGIRTTGNAPQPAAIPTAVHYQIMASNELTNRSACQVPIIFKSPSSNPPPPQLISTTNTNQPTAFMMDGNKQSVNEVRVQPVQTVVLTTTTGNNNASVQSPQVFATTHNGQVLPMIPGATIINTAVNVSTSNVIASNANVLKVDKKLPKQDNKSSQQRQPRKVANLLQTQQSQNQQHIMKQQTGDGQQQQQTPHQCDVVTASNDMTSKLQCNNALTISKPRKSYSSTKGKTKRDETTSVATLVNKINDQRLQQKRPAISISPVLRVPNVGNCGSTNTASTGTIIEEKKQKDTAQGRQQKSLGIPTVGVNSSPSVHQLLIVMNKGEEQWVQLSSGSFNSDFTNILKKSGVPEPQLEDCKSAILCSHLFKLSKKKLEIHDNCGSSSNDINNCICNKISAAERDSNPSSSHHLSSLLESQNNNINNNNGSSNTASTTTASATTTNTTASSSDSGGSGEGGGSSCEQPPIKMDINEVPVYQEGKLAVCQHCGFSSPTFNQCLRCKSRFPPDVKSIDIQASPVTILDSNSQITRQIIGRSPQHLVRKSSTDSSGNGNGSSPECPKKKAKLQERKKSKTKVEEPVCLTISSDEEGSEQDNTSLRSGTRCDDNMAMTSINSQRLQPPILDDQLPADDFVEHVTCRTVRIGSYKVVPSDQVVLTSQFVDISVPSIEDSSKSIKVRIPYSQIVKVLAHYGRGLPVFFIYTTPLMGSKIRDVLKMISKDGFYYDPASKVETQKRITLLPERLSDTAKCKIKAILSNFFDKNMYEELCSKEANDILVRASPKEVQNILRKTGMPRGMPSPIQTIMVYPPPPMKGGIPINTEDYACLGEDQFLNDVIIDFYLKYLTLNMLSKEDQERTHVLSSFFYKRLTTKPTGTRRSYNPLEDDPDATAAEKRHSRVKSWTKAVNIFTKDFIIIPINENCHWFLAIICFPGLTGPVRFSDNTPITLPTPAPKRKHSTLIEGCTDKELANNVMAGKTSLMIGSTTITAVNTNTLAVSAAPLNTITLEPEDEDRDEADGEDEDWENESSEDDQESYDNNSKSKDSQEPPVVKESDKNEEKEIDNKKQQMEEQSKQVIPPPPPLPSTPNIMSNVKISASPSKAPSREPIKQPCILIFDSLAGASRARVVATLRDYLRIEYRAKHGCDRDFSNNVMKGASPKVPQQTNYTDCGLYVLQYVEAFFQNPITDYNVPIKMLQNWFTADEVSRKRFEIQQLLHRLMEEQKVDRSLLNLPDLNLRSGGLVDYPGIDMEDEEMDEEHCSQYSEEYDEEGEEEDCELDIGEEEMCEEEEEEEVEDEEEEAEEAEIFDRYEEAFHQSNENYDMEEGSNFNRNHNADVGDDGNINKLELQDCQSRSKVDLKSIRIARLVPNRKMKLGLENKKNENA
ncbi:uncharacterized protein LOC142331448 isoform X2 [Lycorma delicatula]|uniref:uncharacterized protein LOC142331448 isoform X2 n=1 Tax=Lycorma delicatula TaxID=130591 RepID=UPI003F514746